MEAAAHRGRCAKVWATEPARVPDTDQQDVWLRLQRNGASVIASYSLEAPPSLRSAPIDASWLAGAHFGVLAEVENPSAADTPFLFNKFTVDGAAVPFTSEW